MGLGHTLSDTTGLIKHTFAIIGKNKDILKPTWAQAKFALILTALIIIGGILSFIEPLAGITLVTLSILTLIIYFPFYKVGKKAAQAWLVYQTFTGNQCTYDEGKMRAKQNKGDVFLLGLLDITINLVVSRMKSTGRRGSLVMIILRAALGKAVEEVWDLAGHFLLPASIIKEQSLRQSLPDLQGIRSNVPATLTGVFGIDFAGDLALRLVNTINAFLLIGGAIISFKIGSFFPMLLIFLVVIVFNIIAKVFLEMLKNVYFTLFYIAVQMPEKVPREYQDELLQYLQGSNR